MPYERAVCLSTRNPKTKPGDLIDLCRDYPRRRTLSGVSAKVLCLGDQIALVLEGPKDRVDGLIDRASRTMPGAGMQRRFRSTSESRAFDTLTIDEIDLAEVQRRDSAAADALSQQVTELLSGAGSADASRFSELACLLESNPKQPERRRLRQLVA